MITISVKKYREQRLWDEVDWLDKLIADFKARREQRLIEIQALKGKEESA